MPLTWPAALYNLGNGSWFGMSQWYCKNSFRDPSNRDVECRWGRQKSWFSTNLWLSDRWLVKCNQHSRRSTVQWFIAVSVDIHLQCRLPRISEFCLSQPTWMTTPKKTEQNLIVCCGKSEAKLTNNRRLHLGIVLLKQATDRHEASHSLSMTAGLLVLSLT